MSARRRSRSATRRGRGSRQPDREARAGRLDRGELEGQPAGLLDPGTAWHLLALCFFLVPLGIIWLMSFGEKTSITDVAITGTLANYLRAFDPVYLQILWKSIWVSVLATALCLLVAYPVAFAICFAPAWKQPLLLAGDPALLDQSLDPDLCADRGVPHQRLRQMVVLPSSMISSGCRRCLARSSRCSSSITTSR